MKFSMLGDSNEMMVPSSRSQRIQQGQSQINKTPQAERAAWGVEKSDSRLLYFHLVDQSQRMARRLQQHKDVKEQSQRNQQSVGLESKCYIQNLYPKLLSKTPPVCIFLGLLVCFGSSPPGSCAGLSISTLSLRAGVLGVIFFLPF